MRTARMILPIFVFVVLAGCASMNSVSEMPAEMDARVKSLQAPAGKALVYIIRPSILGKPFGSQITANEAFIGTTQGGIYIYSILEPGEYKFKVTGHDKDAEFSAKFEAGQTYYIYQSMYPGMIRGFTSLEVVDAAKGRAALNECKLGDKLGPYALR